MNRKIILISAVLTPVFLSALPDGGKVKAGSASFSMVGEGALRVTVSDKAIINYPHFDIGLGESVEFVLPHDHAAVLNRVEGKDPSSILGSLSGNGRVFLVNPSGVYFGPESCVDVGTLVASSLDIADEHFLADRFCFCQKEEQKGMVVNEGVLKSSPEGAIVLMGAEVENRGLILADAGKVVLASAEKIILDFSGDGLIGFSVDSSDLIGRGLIGVNEARAAVQEVLNTEGVEVGAQLVREGGGVRILSSAQIEAGEIALAAGEVEIDGQLLSHGDLYVEAPLRIGLRDHEAAPVVLHSYGEMRLSSGLIDILAWENPETSIASGSHMTLVSENPISADARFFAGGDFSLLRPDGTPADFMSLYDPIVTSVGSVTFGTYNGVSLKVEAAGNITCTGDITITGPDAAACPAPCSGDPDCLNGNLTTRAVLILVAGETPAATPACNPVPVAFSGTMFTNPGGSGSTITLGGNLSGFEYAEFDGSVVLSGDTSITATGASLDTPMIVFNGTVDGNFALTMSGDEGNFLMNDTVGGTTPLAALNVNPGFDASFYAQTINAGSIAIIDSGSGAIYSIVEANTTEAAGIYIKTFAEVVVHQATATGGGEITLIVTSNLGTDRLILNSNFVADGDITLDSMSVVALLGDSTLTSQQGNITITGTALASPSFNSLALSAPMGDISVATTDKEGIGDPDALSAFTISSAMNVMLPAIFTQAGGVSITSDTLALSGNIETIGGPITLDTATTLSSDTAFTSMDGAISLSSIDGAVTLLVDAGSGQLSFNGAVGGTTPLDALNAVAGAIDLGASITTDTMSAAAVIDLTGPVTMTGASTLTAGGDVSFSSTINGGHDLTITTPETVSFGGNIGTLTPIGNLVVTAADIGPSPGVEIKAASVNLDSGSDLPVGNITTTNSLGVTLTASGDMHLSNITAGGAAGAPITITQSDPMGSLLVGGTMSATGDITVTSATPIEQYAITHFISTGGNIDITASYITSPMNDTLTMSAVSGDITVTTAMGGIGTMGKPFQFIAQGLNMTLPSISVTSGGVKITGTHLTLNGDIDTENGPITLNTALSFSSTRTLNSGTAATTLGGPVTSSAVGAGLTILAGEIFQKSSVSLNDGQVNYSAPTIHLGGGIATQGGLINLNGDVLLENGTAVALNTEPGATISIAGEINATSGESLSVLAGTGNINFNGDIGNTTPPSAVTASAVNINFNGTIYAAGQQNYTASNLFNFTASSLISLDSFGGPITFSTGMIKLSAGSDLVAQTRGGDFSFASLEGSANEFCDILTEGGTVTVGAVKGGIGSFLVIGGLILLNGEVNISNGTFISESSILNADGPKIVASEANVTFNALGGTVGTLESPVAVDAGLLVFAGAPQMLANFTGSTGDGTIHSIPSNQPCPLIFNGVTLVSCPQKKRKRKLNLPARTFYIPGIYSQYDSLGSDEYFLPELVTLDYIQPRLNLLYSTEELRK